MVALSVVVVAHAQAAQTSYTVNLSYFTVQMTYPSQVNPGDLVTVNMQANAKNSFTSASLTAQIFYVDGNTLHQLTSVTLNNNGYVNSGSTLNKQITFTVPQNAPRTSLFASITENVQTAYANYYYYPANNNYLAPTAITTYTAVTATITTHTRPATTPTHQTPTPPRQTAE